MTGVAAVLLLLAGLLGAPLALLWMGRGYRHRTPRAQGAFRGGVAGWLAGLALTLAAAALPPVAWSAGSVRELVLHASLVVLTVGGAAVGILQRRG